MGEGIREHLSRAAGLVFRRKRTLQRVRVLAQHQQHVQRGIEQHVVESELVGLRGGRIEWRRQRRRWGERLLRRVTRAARSRPALSPVKRRIFLAVTIASPFLLLLLL